MLLYPVLGVFITAVVTTFINSLCRYDQRCPDKCIKQHGRKPACVILGMVVAGMMSVDMGGPVNKAAYVFGTAQLAEGNFEVMAAVMAGGMVPPLVIALCSTFFKKKFTEKERQSGLVNYIMGLSFITEGVIPFAAQDPLRVIPSCVIGSAAAGGLSMFLGMHPPGASRRTVCSSHDWKSSGISGSGLDRFSNWMYNTCSTEEKYRRIEESLMIRCCIFDLDGTLLNTLKALTLTVNLTLEHFGYEPVDEDHVRQFVGDGYKLLMERVLRYRGDEQLEHYEESLKVYLELFAVHSMDGVASL